MVSAAGVGWRGCHIFQTTGTATTVLSVLECHSLPTALIWKSRQVSHVLSSTVQRDSSLMLWVLAVFVLTLFREPLSHSSSDCFSYVSLAVVAASLSFKLQNILLKVFTCDLRPWPLKVSGGGEGETMPEWLCIICIFWFCYKSEYLFFYFVCWAWLLVKELIEEDKVNVHCLGFALLSHMASWPSSAMICDWSVPGFGIFAELHTAEKADAHSKYPPLSDLTASLIANHFIFFLLSQAVPVLVQVTRACRPSWCLLPFAMEASEHISHPVAAGVFGKKLPEGVLGVLWNFGVRFWAQQSGFGMWQGCPTTWPMGTSEVVSDWPWAANGYLRGVRSAALTATAVPPHPWLGRLQNTSRSAGYHKHSSLPSVQWGGGENPDWLSEAILLCWRGTCHCLPLWWQEMGHCHHQDRFHCWLKAKEMELKSSPAA